ncbi:MAG: DUF2683 family protein [Candidatus ainarchaeum sp.]|nr:DUF2683 family protein [Candidatus ainarchaeum sp.]
MPTAIVKLDEQADHVINIVKAKYQLKDKSSAINQMAKEYGAEILEPALRPEYIEKLKRLEKEKSIPIKNIDAYFAKLKKG